MSNHKSLNSTRIDRPKQFRQKSEKIIVEAPPMPVVIIEQVPETMNYDRVIPRIKHSQALKFWEFVIAVSTVLYLISMLRK